MCLRCVIVDDNESFLRAARELLEREGIVVAATAMTGAEALRVAKQVRPDLMLIDIDLGSESGLDLVRRLTGGPDGCTSRLILISAHSQADFEELIEASPVAGFVSKDNLSADEIHHVLERGR